MDEVQRRSFLGYSAFAVASMATPVGFASDAWGADSVSQSFSTEENKKLAREYYKVIDREGPGFGKHYHTANSVYHGANHTGFDTIGIGNAFYTAFPDFTHIILDQVAEGDIVVERIRYFATHLGEFMGIAPTGRQITYTGMDWVRFENGKVAERWGVADEAGLRRQLLGLADPHEMQTNTALAHEYYEVIDREGIPAGEPYEAKTSTYHGANHTGFDAKGRQHLADLIYTAFPDFTHVIMEQIAEGDTVVERIRYFMTHKGEFMGIPATGRQITYTGMDWVRYKEGRVIERWGVPGSLGQRRQLLGLPDPHPEQTKAQLASDRAAVEARFGKSAGKPFDRISL